MKTVYSTFYNCFKLILRVRYVVFIIMYIDFKGLTESCLAVANTIYYVELHQSLQFRDS